MKIEDVLAGSEYEYRGQRVRALGLAFGTGAQAKRNVRVIHVHRGRDIGSPITVPARGLKPVADEADR